MCELHAEKHFYIQISIELTIEIVWHVINQLLDSRLREREHSLSYLVVCVSCSYANPVLSYGCFYCHRLIVRNHYFRKYDVHVFITTLWLCIDQFYIGVCFKASFPGHVPMFHAETVGELVNTGGIFKKIGNM